MEKKPGIALIIASKMKEKKGEEGEEDKYTEMAKDILAAIEKKDAKALGVALSSFIKVCSGE